MRERGDKRETEWVGGIENDSRRETGSVVTNRALTFYWLNENLLICHTLTFLHFTTHYAPGCTKLCFLLTVNWAGVWSFYWHTHPVMLTFWVLQCTASCNTWFCIDPCKETPPTSPSTGRSGWAAEQLSWSWEGFSLLLKGTWDRCFNTSLPAWILSFYSGGRFSAVIK